MFSKTNKYTSSHTRSNIRRTWHLVTECVLSRLGQIWEDQFISGPEIAGGSILKHSLIHSLFEHHVQHPFGTVCFQKLNNVRMLKHVTNGCFPLQIYKIHDKLVRLICLYQNEQIPTTTRNVHKMHALTSNP